MTEVFKRLIQLEDLFEEIRDEDPQYYAFYTGYLKGLRDFKWLILKNRRVVMEYREKLEICQKEMAKEFGISENKAGEIILWLELDDIVLERYEDSILEKENRMFENWELERKLNPDLF